MKNYIANKVFGLDEATGLEIELRVKELLIEASNRKITIKIDKVLVSPTGLELKVIESLYYDRFDGDVNKKYEQLELSSIGLGILDMLLLDLDVYPNLTQK